MKTNSDRIRAWHERYRAATGQEPDHERHMLQVFRGIAWQDRECGRIVLRDGYLPLRPLPDYVRAALNLEAKE